MNEEHRQQLQAFKDKVDSCMDDLKLHITEEKNSIDNLNHVVFGNEGTREKGMKEKVDEMHEIMVQFKGIKGLFGVIVLFGLVIITLKGWFIK